MTTPAAQRFVCVPIEMIGNEKISPLAIAVFVAIAQHADQSGRCWPSVGRLASMVNHSDRTVRRALAQLIDAGYLVRQTRTNDATGEQRSNLYTVRRIRLLFEADVERPTSHDETWDATDTGRTSVSSPPDTPVIPPPDTAVIPPLTHLSGRTRSNRTRSTLKIPAQQDARTDGGPKPHPIRDLLTVHETLFLQATGEKSPPPTGRDVATLKRLLARYSQIELDALLRRFFQSTDPFIRQSGWTVSAFSACLSKVIAQDTTMQLSARTSRTLRAAQEFTNGN